MMMLDATALQIKCFFKGAIKSVGLRHSQLLVFGQGEIGVLYIFFGALADARLLTVP